MPVYRLQSGVLVDIPEEKARRLGLFPTQTRPVRKSVSRRKPPEIADDE